MKESFYFSHDYNARNDDKILEIRDKYKNDGYAVFFYCLETMAERGDGYLIPSLLGGLSLSYGVGKEWLSEFLEFCVKIGIFKKDDKGYYNSRMIDHINFRAKLSQAGTEGAKKRWGGYSTPNAKERKGKKRKYNTADKSAEEFPLKEKKDTPVNKPAWDFNTTLNSWLTGKNKAYQLIGEFFKGKKLVFNTSEQMQVAAKRHLRAAMQLAVFTDEQIDEAMGKIKQNSTLKNEWTLETIIKYITK